MEENGFKKNRKEAETICTGTFGSSYGILCSRHPEWISATVYAAQEQTNSVKEETTKSEEQEQAVKGSFDLTDGVYKGTGTGYAGDITVAVQIKDRQITAIDILSSSDDAAFFKRAQAVIDKIIEGQTLEVDTVSGATYSSRGIISAVKNALTRRKRQRNNRTVTVWWRRGSRKFYFCRNSGRPGSI